MNVSNTNVKWIRVYAALLAICPVGLCAAQSPSPTPKSTPAPSPTVSPSEGAKSITALPLPDDQAAIEKRTIEIQERLGEMGELTEPAAEATVAEKALHKARANLRDTLTQYVQALESLANLRAQSAELASAEAIEKRTALVADYRRRMSELDAKAQRPARRAVEVQADLDETREEYEQLNTAVESESKLETSRQEQLAGYAQREKDIEAALTAARNQLDAFLKSPPPASEGVDPETAEKIAALRLRNLVRTVELEAIRRERVVLSKSVMSLESTASQSILPVMREYQTKLGDFRRELHKYLTQNLVDRIEANLARSKSDVEKAYWQYRKVIAEAQQFFGTRISDIRQRFREGNRVDINRDVSRLTIRYDRIIDGLSRSSSGESKAAYEELAELIDAYTERQARLIAKLDASLREQDVLLLEQDRTYETMESREAALRKEIEALGDDNPEKRQKYEAYLTEITVEHIKAMEDLIKRVLDMENDLIARLNQSIKSIDAFIEKLQMHRDKLFWSYTLARDVSVVQHVRAGVAEMRSPRPTERVGDTIESLGVKFRNVSRTQWGWFVGTLVVAMVGGWVVRRRLLATAQRREDAAQTMLKEQDQESVPFTVRLRIQSPSIWARWSPIALPLGVVLGGLLLWDEVDPQRTMMIRLVIFLLGATFAFALIFGLFEVAKPRYRIIPCSNVVAQHYRRWGAAILLASLVMAPVIAVLEGLDIAPDGAAALQSIYRAVVMVMLLIFARQRRTVVRIVGRRFTQRHPRWISTIIGAYPLAVATVAILLVLQLIGYDALVGYVVRNIGQTALAVLVAIFLSNLIEDWAPAPKAKPLPADAEVDEQSTAATEAQWFDLMVEDYEAKEMSWLAHVAGSLCRWIIAIGTVVWICAAWGMTQVTAKWILTYPITRLEDGKPSVTVWRVIVALIVMFVAVKVSRGTRATLQAKVYPAYPTIDRGAQATINVMIHYTLLVVGLYIGMRFLHLNLGALAVLLGGLGLGLGLGLQPLIVNFVSGVIMLAERHVKVGDLVEVEGNLGEVTSVSMRSTQIKSFDNIDLIIPNSEFVTGRVTNWTLQDTRIRGKLDVGVAYGTDVLQVRDILLEIAQGEALVESTPEPMVWFVNFGESSLDFTLAIWFKSPGDRWWGMINIRYEIVRRFKEAGIEIPFPQRTISFLPESSAHVALARGKAATLRPSNETMSPGLPKDGPSGAEASESETSEAVERR